MTYDQLNKIGLKIGTGSWKLVLLWTFNKNVEKGLWSWNKYQLIDVSTLDLTTVLLSCQEWACTWLFWQIYLQCQWARWQDKILMVPCWKTLPAVRWMLNLYNNTETLCLFFIGENAFCTFETHCEYQLMNGTHSSILYSAIPRLHPCCHEFPIKNSLCLCDKK